ncbi:MAG TPA: type I-E CRISPR-associated protein Cse2/CasB [Anaerolineae bacterium]|nr:type I-E CRISPR-associated protein Cse2/CasB [Anaerolineae bacterium]HID83821.1 type I-E CRISPR-associated protein Cse2/CasB [Anaerolineales bacterium]HIQ09064.1 type I-E CRISPR-associated protein Cse2/CasB [Anaerolineaceae bacterium]
MSLEREVHSFVQYLLTLADDRAALAALRRGLGRPPGTAPEMFPYVVPQLPAHVHPNEEAAYYTLAALFALHPSHTNQGNLGDHLARAANQGNREAVERRFVALLSAHPDDLPEYLRQTVSFLKAQEVPINWDALFYALRYWEHPEHGDRIRRDWARAFWAEQSAAETSEA